MLMGRVFSIIGVLMGEVGDEAHESNEQTESDAGDLAKCNGSSKIEMTVGAML